MERNNDYRTGNLLDYGYFSTHCKFIAVEHGQEIELENLDLKKQVNFISRLNEDDATMFFIIEKPEEATFKFSQNSVNVV